MGMEFGREVIMSRILESGRSQKLMGLEFTLGRMGIGMRESGKTVSSTDKAQSCLQMEMFMSEVIE
jgi:hypothetical protein